MLFPLCVATGPPHEEEENSANRGERARRGKRKLKTFLPSYTSRSADLDRCLKSILLILYPRHVPSKQASLSR